MDRKIELITQDIKGLYLVKQLPHVDNRGAFKRVYCAVELSNHLNGSNIQQINSSFTKKKGSIRGLHFQYSPYHEARFVQCLKGGVFDVVVDIRKDSETFLHFASFELSETDNTMVYVPPGFAHGFQTLTDDVEILYLHTGYYSKEFESGLRYNDPVLSIDWPLEVTDISERDSQHKLIDNDFEGLIIAE